MGSYLGQLGPSPFLAEGLTDLPQSPVTHRPSQAFHQVHRVQHVHRAHPAPRLGLAPARRPRNWDPTNPSSRGANEAWKRFPMKRPQNSVVGPLPSDWWESYLKRTIWSLRHPRAVWSPVTVKITPQRGLPAKSPAQAISLAGPSPSGQPTYPHEKETVLRALKECKKGTLRLEEPPPSPSAGKLDGKRSPDATPSAFKPMMRSEDLSSFVPSLGPLKRSLDSWSSDCSLSRKPSSSSMSSSASSHVGGPLSSKRNAITSSYSSSRGFSRSWKKSALCTSFQMPEWPVKKKAGHRGCSPAPLAPLESPAASGSTGQQDGVVPGLLSHPGTRLSLSLPPQPGCAVPDEDLALGTKAGLQRSSKLGKDTVEVTTNSPLSVTLPSAGTAPNQGANLHAASPGPLASPQSKGEGIDVAPSPLQTPSLLAPLWCAPSEPLPGLLSDTKPIAAITLLTPPSPTAPVTDTTWPPQTCQVDRSARPPDLLAVTSVVPSTQRTLSGMVRRPAHYLSASVPPTATLTEPTSKPILGSPPNSEIGDCSPSRILVTAAAYSHQGTPVPTFKPIFGSIEPLKSMPEIAPLSTVQTSSAAAPVATYLFQDLVMAAPVAMSSTPDSTSKDSSFKPPLDLGIVGATSTEGSTYSVPSTSCTFLPGASCAFGANFSPVTGLIFPPLQHSTIPMVDTVNTFNQVLSSDALTSPSKITANFKGKGSPLSTSTLIITSQPSFLPGISNPTSVSTVPLGTCSKLPFPLSMGSAPKPAFGAAGEQKQRASRPALDLSSSSTSVFGNSAIASPTPAAAQPAFHSPTQSACGVQTPLAPIFHIPTGIQPDVGSTPAGFPLGQAGATGFGVITQSCQSGAYGSVFGTTAPRPFAFGGLVTPMDCEESEVPNMNATFGVLSIGAMPSRATHTVLPFGKGWSQNTQGLTSQSNPFALERANIPTRKTILGGPSMVPLTQSIPVPRPVKTGNSFGFRIPSPPAKGSVGRESFKSLAPSFSIGAKPRTSQNRDRVHPRRHHKK